MAAPQIIYAALMLFGLLRAYKQHGQFSKPVRENFFVTLTAYSILIAVLWWGGFWK